MKNNMKINRRDFIKSSVLAGLPQADIDLLDWKHNKNKANAQWTDVIS